MRSSFLPIFKPKITRISALPNKQGSQPTAYTIEESLICGLHSPKNHQKKYYDPFLFGRAEILVIFGLHLGRNDDLINSF